MHKKILIFNKAIQKIPPHTITLISGSFEPFGEYYFRLLLWASRQNRPLAVIVQKDDMVLMRRGFFSLSTTHKTRAEIISSLEFVDYVIIANKTAHDKECITQLQPKVIVFQNDNLAYRKTIGRTIRLLDPSIKVEFAPFRPSGFKINRKHRLIPRFKSNEIAKELLSLTTKRMGNISRISAILTNDSNKIIAESVNSEEGEHAEILLLRNAQSQKISLRQCYIYILIPPCLMCAEKIAKHRLKKVFYLFSYGEKDGIEYLRSKNIPTKKF